MFFKPEEERLRNNLKKKEPKVPCSCGSGKKYKKCHMSKFSIYIIAVGRQYREWDGIDAQYRTMLLTISKCEIMHAKSLLTICVSQTNAYKTEDYRQHKLIND
jgi:hypothetical protein